MIVAGCAIGSLTGKALIMKDSKILAYSIVPSTIKPEKTSRNAMDTALENVGLKSGDIEYIVGTGYGRMKVSFADLNVSELSCHGKGSHWLIPSIRTVIDVGGQDCKVIRLDDDGRILDFAMNDKCAAGTGRFLEVMAKAMEVKLDDLGELSKKSVNPAQITSQCSVFAETEVISLIAQGVEVVDIIGGIHESIASRIASLVHKVGLKEDVTVTGGVAKNSGVIEAIKKKLGVEIKKLPLDPQVIGALGAALIAQEKYSSKK
ncbi:MAG: acyl-CoA dehydratase activase [Candidatus Jordarchaeum sp.]|uniref:acyl-CoA dehydratase activase n=1 Tax=Candidatus Jordarchaeum sp. TaxID=2823881 RepID=UPI00404A4B6C